MALPWEDRLPGEEDMCALLQKSLYGMRDAATNRADAQLGRCQQDTSIPVRVTRDLWF